MAENAFPPSGCVAACRSGREAWWPREVYQDAERPCDFLQEGNWQMRGPGDERDKKAHEMFFICPDSNHSASVPILPSLVPLPVRKGCPKAFCCLL